MDVPEFRMGDHRDVWPCEWLPSADFAANVAYVRAMPAETDAWLLAAVNRIRDRAVGDLPAFTSADLWSQFYACSDSESDALTMPRVDRDDPERRVMATAELLMLFTRVFGLAFAPPMQES